MIWVNVEVVEKRGRQKEEGERGGRREGKERRVERREKRGEERREKRREDRREEEDKDRKGERNKKQGSKEGSKQIEYSFYSLLQSVQVTLNLSFWITPLSMLFRISRRMANIAMLVLPAPVGAEMRRFSLV